MVIYPAIDLFEGKAVRLYKGDYAQMTVYNEDPAAVAADFKAKGAAFFIYGTVNIHRPLTNAPEPAFFVDPL